MHKNVIEGSEAWLLYSALEALYFFMKIPTDWVLQQLHHLGIIHLAILWSGFQLSRPIKQDGLPRPDYPWKLLHDTQPRTDYHHSPQKNSHRVLLSVFPCSSYPCYLIHCCVDFDKSMNKSKQEQDEVHRFKVDYIIITTLFTTLGAYDNSLALLRSTNGVILHPMTARKGVPPPV